MIKQISNKIAREIDKLNEQETSAVLEYVSELLSSRRRPNSNENINDDLIAVLSEKRENRRACQVVEWEKTRRRNNHRAV